MASTSFVASRSAKMGTGGVGVVARGLGFWPESAGVLAKPPRRVNLATGSFFARASTRRCPHPNPSRVWVIERRVRHSLGLGREEGVAVQAWGAFLEDAHAAEFVVSAVEQL